MPEPFITKLTENQMKKVLQPIEGFIWLLTITLLAVVLLLPVSSQERYALFGLFLLSGGYIYFYFHRLIPESRDDSLLFHLTTVFGVFLIAGFHYLLGSYNLHVDKFYLLVIIFIGIFGSWEWILPVFILTGGVNYIINNFLWDNNSTFYVFNQLFEITSLGIAALVGIFLSRTIQMHHDITIRQNKSLRLLVENNAFLSPRAPLMETLPTFARLITEGLPTTTCRITLLNNKKDQLLDYGVSPLRYLEGINREMGGEYQLEKLPKHKEALEKKQVIVLDQDLPQDTLTDFERKAIFWEDVRTACIVPILLDGEVLGLVSIGEARSLDREPFDQVRMDLLSTLTNQIAATINTSYLHRDLENQAQRMTVLYDVGQAISRTIEIDDLLVLIHQQLKKVLPSDAYFVALYRPEEHQLDLRMLIDKGKRFPPRRTDADQGISSWIVRHKKPLLIENLSEEIEDLGVDPIQVGENEITRSWMGVPLLHEDEFIGLIAVASYRSHVFDREDLALLEQIARQAALSITNAHHHQKVEEQACKDSLTEVLNHGTFISCLEEEAEQAQQDGTPLSLIMLDIDHFKKYNDSYGHVIGDQVLKLTAQTIKSHIKEKDLVGRWGGEEFGIALPGANSTQARQVAERIRQTLTELPLTDSDGNPIPKPTVSQGIAALLEHTRDVHDLIIIADRALYQAKDQGRDQIRTA
jgi:diguanylate cyclase (GGDEF)-like protein